MGASTYQLNAQDNAFEAEDDEARSRLKFLNSLLNTDAAKNCDTKERPAAARPSLQQEPPRFRVEGVGFKP